jgi:hypothetical protein
MPRSRWFWVALLVLLLFVGMVAIDLVYNHYLNDVMTVTPGGCPDPC